MARYAQFTAESFAARTKPAPPPLPVGDGDYGSLLVVRVGRPKKRPVLMLDPAEAAAEAVRFQQVAAHDFANPDEAIRRSAVVRLSAMAANESGLEAEDTAAPSTAQADADADADLALAMWTDPAEPVDPTDWNDGAEVDTPPPREADAASEEAVFDAPVEEPVAAWVVPDPAPTAEPLFEVTAPIEPEVALIAEPIESETDRWTVGADDAEYAPEVDEVVRPSLWRRMVDAVREFLAAF